MPSNPKDPAKLKESKLDRIVAEARLNREKREQDYREQALKLYPWICGRCTREFTRANLQQLTVHHKDHNHDNNPSDGSNWELLCVYCHDNEHSRYLESAGGGSHPGGGISEGSALQLSEGPAHQLSVGPATHNPFANLKSLLNGKA